MYINKKDLTTHYLLNSSYKTNYNSKLKIFKRIYFLTIFFSIILRGWFNIISNKYSLENCKIDSLTILNYLEKAGFKFEIIGLDELKKVNSPTIFICNHMSMIETLILPGILMHYTKLSIIAKQGLSKYLFFSTILNFINTIYVSRKDKKSDLIELTEKTKLLINNNSSILVFPQSTRCTEFDPKNFRKIGLRIACTNNIPIIVIAVKSDAWEIGKLLKDFGKFNIKKKIYVEFSELLYPKSYNLIYHIEILKFISERLNSWG